MTSWYRAFILFTCAFVLSAPAWGQVAVSLPDVGAEPGEQITISVSVDDLTGLGVRGYQGQIRFDPSVIVLESASTENTLSAGASVSSNVTNLDTSEGRFAFAYASGTSLSGAGTLFTINARVEGEGTSPLSFFAFFFNDFFDDQYRHNQPASTTSDGSVEASTSISVIHDEMPAVTFALLGHYPEPSSGRTTIELDLAQPGDVSVQVVDLLGREVFAISRSLDAGTLRRIELDAGALAAGTYLYRVTAQTGRDRHVGTGTLVIVR